MTSNKDSQAILDRLTALHPRLIDLSLDRLRVLLAALGHPQRRLPPVIHVAGTNGKGSTIAFLRAILEVAGYRVQAYTSPHLRAFNERIRLVDGLVDSQILNHALEICEEANANAPITFFEITTAAAFLCFSEDAQAKADILLLETGLGGRLDATNVIDQPIMTAITPISMDHMQFLGDDLASIAAEKAGILKPDVPVIVAPQPEQALATIMQRAGAVGAPAYRCHHEWCINPVEDPAPTSAFVYRGRSWSLDLPSPALVGAHQHVNAGVAIACLENLPGFEISAPSIARGLTRVEWPGRLQRLTRGILTELLPRDWELWVDGGHNPAAAIILAQAVSTWRDRPLYLVYGMLRSKDMSGFLSPLAPFIDRGKAISIAGEPSSFTAEQAAIAGRTAGIAVDAAVDLQTALSQLAQENRDSEQSSGPCRVLICGSLYLAGWALKINDSEAVLEEICADEVAEVNRQ